MASNPPNPSNGAAPGAASASASTSIHVHKLNGLSKPTLVFSHNLGPEHPAILSFTIQGICREIDFWWKHFAQDCRVDFAPRRFEAPPSLSHVPNLVPWSHPYSIRRYDTLSFCKECVRLLSRRTCDGSTVISYQGCDFHRKHLDVPFAYRRRDIHTPRTNFLRETKEMFWNPKSRITMFYLSKNPFPITEPFMSVTSNGTVIPMSSQTPATQNPDEDPEAKEADENKTNSRRRASVPRPRLASLEHVPFLHFFREINERANLPRVKYLHTDSCLHGSKPDCIVQGAGVAGLYYKRCDSRFVNALGEVLNGPATPPPQDPSANEQPTSTKLTTCEPQQILSPPPLTTDLHLTSAQIAELAWRRHHPTAGPDVWADVKAQKKRQAADEAAAHRAAEQARRVEKLATLVPRTGEWVRQRGQAVRARKDRVGAWCMERIGFWGA